MTATTTVSTRQGDARVVRHGVGRRGVGRRGQGPPRVTVLLSHGAAGGLDAADLVAAAAVLPEAGIEVLLVEQPWRVAGRRLAPRPELLDEAFSAVVAAIAPPSPFVVGGRSAGARVACRTAAGLGAVGVLALAFPLHPPGRPERSRTAELAGVGVPALVVQGARDPFGSPGDVRAALGSHQTGDRSPVRVVEVPGADHGFAVRIRDGGATARDDALTEAFTQVASFLWAAARRPAAGNS